MYNNNGLNNEEVKENRKKNMVVITLVEKIPIHSLIYLLKL